MQLITTIDEMAKTLNDGGGFRKSRSGETQLITIDEMAKTLNDGDGFRKSWSGETELITTIDEMAKTLNDGEQSDVAFLDFSKAFDQDNHHKLCLTLWCWGNLLN